MNIQVILLHAQLKKVIRCYCFDCVKPENYKSPDKFYSYKEENLIKCPCDECCHSYNKNLIIIKDFEQKLEYNCCCFDCIKPEHYKTPDLIYFDDIILKTTPMKKYMWAYNNENLKNIDDKKMWNVSSRRSYLKTKDNVDYVYSNDFFKAKFIYPNPDYTIDKKKLETVYFEYFGVKKFKFWFDISYEKLKQILWHYYYTRYFKGLLKYDSIYGYEPYILYDKYVEYGVRLYRFDPNGTSYNDKINIMYLNFDYDFPDIAAIDIIKYRNITNKEMKKSGNFDINTYNKVRDIWCYECEKYKGACLGHEYPDPDEFKFVIKNKEEQSNYKKIKELETAIQELNNKIMKLI